MIKRLGFTILVLFVVFTMDMGSLRYAAQAQSKKLTYVPDEIIVRFHDGTDESQKDLARFRVFGKRKKLFKVVPGLEVIRLARGVSVEDALDAIRQSPQVLYAEPNYILHMTANPNITATPNDSSFGSLWGLTKINAPGAWNITTGSGNVVVAVIDTGIDYTHPDLAANMFQNTADCNSNGIDDDGNGYIDDCFGIDVANGDSDPMDDHYHGTHVAGTIGAVGNNAIGVVGVNWNVKLLACKFFDASGSATTEGAIECLDYVKNMKDRGVNIVATSNSWGGNENSQALYDAIDVQRQHGILFIAGAGNGNAFGVGQNNDTTPFYPCNYFLANIVCVAATTSNDSKAGFSNYGRRTVHLGAPGNGILSTVPGNGYTSLSGTSMATPHVSGLAALLQAQNPSRDWRAIKNLILAGGDTVSSMTNTITRRRLNANGSMTCSNTVVQSRLQPIANTISASPGVPVNLASLHIKCASANGNVSVAVSPGNQTITLLDDGLSSDQAPGDGIYSGQWTPAAAGTYTLTFPGNDRVTVNVANPTINVTPSSLDFGGVGVGSSVDKNLTVKNSGGGILSGTASISAPSYSIIAGGSYNLSGGQSQNVTVRFTPSSQGTFLGNVSFTGGNGASVPVSGSGVLPAKIALSFDGKLADRVGQADAAMSPDGSMDATLTVTLQAGSGNRTVTALDLRHANNAGIRWNTTPDISWILGAAPSLGGALYNSANATVNFAVADGGNFKVFASDQNNSLFPSGTSLLLTTNFSDGSTATATVTVPSPPPPPPAPTLALSFDGKLADRVGQGDGAMSPDGFPDATLTVTLQAGSGNRTVTALDLRHTNNAGIRWNTTSDSWWILGAAPSLGGALYNSANATVNFAVADGGTFNIFASDSNNSLFSTGTSLLLTANFADGSTATATVTAP